MYKMHVQDVGKQLFLFASSRVIWPCPSPSMFHVHRGHSKIKLRLKGGGMVIFVTSCYENLEGIEAVMCRDTICWGCFD